MAKNLTLSIPDDLSNEMEKLPEINWSQIARNAISEYITLRTKSALPADLLDRLRKERGDEYVRGKQFAVERILPGTTYVNLDALLAATHNKAQAGAQQEADYVGVEIEMANWEKHTDAALSLVFKSYLPTLTTPEFRKGLLDTLEGAFRLSRK